MSYRLMFSQVTPYIRLLLQGLGRSVYLSCIGMAIGLCIGILVGVARTGKSKALRAVVNVYVEIFRNTPLLIQMYLIYFGLPQFGITLGAEITAIIALSLNNGAYTGVIFESGYRSVNIGQTEAAAALGMTKAQTVVRIIIPQALRIVIGPLTNQFISIFLFSSVASTISVKELLTETLYIDSLTMRTFEVYIITTILYLAVTTVITLSSNYLEKRTRH